MKISVLMSLYYKESASFLCECLESINNQSIPADEVIVVEDGPLTSELYSVLDEWQSRLPLIRVSLEENVGLGRALNHGLKKCSHDVIARMDTDDICHPMRFEKQISILKDTDVDICGSWVSEFETSCELITAFRCSPETHSEIVATSRLRNPLNHPSVMYRKSAVLDVGSYDDVLFFEDYHLWLKLIDHGYKFYNIQEPLVAMRAGIAQLSRRGGLNYAVLELAFLKRSSREGIIRKRYALRNAIIRFPLRILPTKTLGNIYRIIRSREA
ncbi:glycosyltransferase [Vibrio hibernica]|uniref:glycosyltransferase n=1 Tax=Vibrio hibernica TaxID=2587465 RepID=UPI00187EAB5A|nr:glycosyltransferase [Vibrio hibernica]